MNKKRELIFQAFNWTIQGVKENLPKIAEQGFNIIQLSPLQQHKEKHNPTWYLAYQVTNYKIGNRLGTKEELKELCDLAHTYNIKIIIDVVFNHVGNNGGGNQELIPSIEVEDEIRLRPDFFHSPFQIKDYENRDECTQGCIGLPDLNTASHDLQDLHINYLKQLLSSNVDGFRIDAMRHIELPDDPNCGSDYWDRVLGSIPNKDTLFIYGEVIYSSDELINRYGKYTKVGVNTPTTLPQNDTVRWSLSHDDDLTFNVAGSKHKNKDIILNEWQHILEYYPNTHMLFYPCANDNTWADSRMKYINNTYR
jgi:alpha-amylase